MFVLWNKNFEIILNGGKVKVIYFGILKTKQEKIEEVKCEKLFFLLKNWNKWHLQTFIQIVL